MFASLAQSFRPLPRVRPAPAAAWRWRYRDPLTGEVVDHSELLTAAEVRAIDPYAELIPGSRVMTTPARLGAFAAR